MTTLITTYQHDFPAPDVNRYNITVQKEIALREADLKLKCSAQQRDKWEHAKPEGEWTRNQVMGMLLHPRIIPDMKERPECVPDHKFKVNEKPEQYPFAAPAGFKRCPDHKTTYQCDFPNLKEECDRRFHKQGTPIDMDVLGCEKDPCGKRRNQENDNINKYGRVRGITRDAMALKSSISGGGGGGGGGGTNGGQGGNNGGGGGGGSGGSGGGNGGGSSAFGGSGSKGKDPGPPCSECLAPPTEYQSNIGQIGDMIQTKHFHNHSKCKGPKSCKHIYVIRPKL